MLMTRELLSRSRQNAFIRSASSGSASRRCSTDTVLLASPFATKVTFTRLSPPAQSKRADFGLVDVRSRSSPCSRNASKSRSTGTGRVFVAVTAKPSSRWPASRPPRVRS